MNDLEKIFSDGLKHHEVVPPPEPWDQLAQRLQYQRRQRRAVYMSVAAACLLFFTVGIGFYSQDTPPSLAGSVPVKDSANSLRTTKQVADIQVDKENLQPNALDGIDRVLSAEVATVTHLPTKSSTTAAPLEIPPLKVPPVLAEQATADVAKVPRETPPTRTLVVDASRYRKAEQDTSTSVASPSVTIVYQPNPATLAQEESLSRKVTDALTQIKASKMSLGELRSAKDDLVDKVLFDRKSDESPPQ